MARIVMKFGGTSMAGIERIRVVAARVKHEVELGNEVAVVVSAMAGDTDRLVGFCREASSLYDPRNMTCRRLGRAGHVRPARDRRSRIWA
jgi:aspartate kinase